MDLYHVVRRNSLYRLTRTAYLRTLIGVIAYIEVLYTESPKQRYSKETAVIVRHAYIN